MRLLAQRAGVGDGLHVTTCSERDPTDGGQDAGDKHRDACNAQKIIFECHSVSSRRHDGNGQRSIQANNSRTACPLPS